MRKTREIVENVVVLFYFLFWQCVSNVFFYLQLNDVVATRCCSLLSCVVSRQGERKERESGGSTPSPQFSSSQVCAACPCVCVCVRVFWQTRFLAMFFHWSNYYLLLLPARRAGVNCPGYFSARSTCIALGNGRGISLFRVVKMIWMNGKMVGKSTIIEVKQSKLRSLN